MMNVVNKLCKFFADWGESIYRARKSSGVERMY